MRPAGIPPSKALQGMRIAVIAGAFSGLRCALIAHSLQYLARLQREFCQRKKRGGRKVEEALPGSPLLGTGDFVLR